jgi:hypothetical protein
MLPGDQFLERGAQARDFMQRTRRGAVGGLDPGVVPDHLEFRCRLDRVLCRKRGDGSLEGVRGTLNRRRVTAIHGFLYRADHARTFVEKYLREVGEQRGVAIHALKCEFAI